MTCHASFLTCLLSGSLALAVLPAQEPAPKNGSAAIRSDATTMVIPAGKHDVKAIVDAAAAFLRRNILVSATELGKPEPIELQTAMAVDQKQCETVISQLLWSRQLVLLGSEKPDGTYEVIHAQGQRQKDIGSRAILRTVAEVLANPDLAMPVTVHVDLEKTNAAVVTNGLRPLFAMAAGGGGLTIGMAGNNVLILTGLQHDVVRATRVVLKLDGREDEVPTSAQLKRIDELEKNLAELRQRVAELERKLAEKK